MVQLDTKKISFFLLVVLFLVLPQTCFLQNKSHPPADDEFVGPFPSWIDVKKEFNLKGNGKADETAGIQAALNSVGNSTSKATVLYLPGGKYRITKKLTCNNKINISFIGEDPDNTEIIWDGDNGGIMLEIDGTAYSRFNRISYDGKGKASIAIDQSWKGVDPYFDTGNEYADNVFSDVDFGIVGGNSGYGFAEIAIMRCKFFRNKKAGVSLGNFNALDVWVWNSVFLDCAIGVTNGYGAGNFKVYNSIFRNSTSSDIYIGHTGGFSFRDNYSSNSKYFIFAGFTGNPATITIQGNTIVDPTESKAIYINNQGPLTLIDNTIRSRVNATAPVIVHNSSLNGAFFSMGNTFTVSNPYEVGATKIVYDKPVVSAGSLSGLNEPALPGVQPALKRRIFEIPLGSNAVAIQNVINQAAAQSGNRPVVHLPFGTYNISTTLTIPAGSDLQLVGDGNGDRTCTALRWTGGSEGPVINVVGPSKATLWDFSIYGNEIANGVVVTNADQAGSRIFMNQVNTGGNKTNLLVNALDHTRILAYNSNFAAAAKSVIVIGGPLSLSGNPQQGRTILYAGSESNNAISHEVTNGGNLLVRDIWYESNTPGKFIDMSGRGTFTLDGSSTASPHSSSVPTNAITNLAGKATFVGSAVSNYIEVNGNGSEGKILGLSLLTSFEKYIVDNTSPSASIQSLNTRYVDPNSSSSLSAANIGVPNEAFLTTMLEHTRSVHAEVLTPLANNVSDVRFYRVGVSQTIKGIELKGAGAQANQASSANNYDYQSNVLEVLAQDLQVKAKQNPTTDYFTLQTNSSNNELIKIIVTDLLSRKLETKTGIQPNGYLQFGEKYSRGVYFAEVTQGHKKVVIKLLKQ